MAQILRPFTDSYWVEPDRFLAGRYPGSHSEDDTRRRMGAFFQAGIHTFIDLTQPDELAHYDGILHEQAGALGVEASYTRISIQDFGIPPIKSMDQILDTIDSALEKGHKIYIHCWGGVGRTGTVVGCYLVRRGCTGEQALAQMAEWWPNVPMSAFHPRSPETGEQIKFVLNWEK